MAVGSGDLLGIKVIKLNKIKGTQTIGVQICSPLITWRELLFKARNFNLPAQIKTSQTYRRIAGDLLTSKISAQIHRQKIGVGLMPNVES
jgi:hypothetical protein